MYSIADVVQQINTSKAERVSISNQDFQGYEIYFLNNSGQIYCERQALLGLTGVKFERDNDWKDRQFHPHVIWKDWPIGYYPNKGRIDLLFGDDEIIKYMKGHPFWSQVKHEPEKLYKGILATLDLVKNSVG